MAKMLVVGLGNMLKGDDGVGLVLAEQLQPQLPHADVILHSGELLELISLWEGYQTVVVFDAVHSKRKAGSLVKLDLRRNAVAREALGFSSHAFGLAAVIALAKELNKLPETVLFFGIEGCDYTVGNELSAVVQAQLVSLSQTILAELQAYANITVASL